MATADATYTRNIENINRTIVSTKEIVERLYFMFTIFANFLPETKPLKFLNARSWESVSFWRRHLDFITLTIDESTSSGEVKMANTYTFLCMIKTGYGIGMGHDKSDDIEGWTNNFFMKSPALPSSFFSITNTKRDCVTLTDNSGTSDDYFQITQSFKLPEKLIKHPVIKEMISKGRMDVVLTTFRILIWKTLTNYLDRSVLDRLEYGVESIPKASFKPLVNINIASNRALTDVIEELDAMLEVRPQTTSWVEPLKVIIK